MTFKTLDDSYQMNFGFMYKEFNLRDLKIIWHHIIYLSDWIYVITLEFLIST